MRNHLLRAAASSGGGGGGSSITGDPTAGFVEFSRRLIESDTFMGNDSDYTGGYDVSDVTIPATFSGSARIYLGHKNSIAPPGQVWYADAPIACIQILNSAGNSLLKSWNWSGGGNQGWENEGTTTEFSGTSSVGFPATLAAMAARNYGLLLSSSVDEYKWSVVSSTASSYTGAADGISSDYSENGVDSGIGTILPAPGDAVVSQVSSTDYIYRETSQSERYSGVCCRSPAYTFSGGEIIRIAHAVTGYSAAPMDEDDTLYIGVT